MRECATKPRNQGCSVKNEHVTGDTHTKGAQYVLLGMHFLTLITHPLPRHRVWQDTFQARMLRLKIAANSLLARGKTFPNKVATPIVPGETCRGDWIWSMACHISIRNCNEERQGFRVHGAFI